MNHENSFEDESTECTKTEGEEQYGELVSVEPELMVDSKKMEFDGVLTSSSVEFFNAGLEARTLMS